MVVCDVHVCLLNGKQLFYSFDISLIDCLQQFHGKIKIFQVCLLFFDLSKVFVNATFS